MRTNLLKQKCYLQVKTSTPGPLGPTETWAPAGDHWCRLIPLDVKTITAYQQQKTEVTHRLELGGDVDVNIGSHRAVIGAFTYLPTVSAQKLADNTVVLVKQV